MKKNMMMSALVAGLLGMAGTAIAADNTQPVPCPPPGVTRPVNSRGAGMAPDVRSIRQDMKKLLGLSDSQAEKVREMRRTFFSQSKPVMQSIGYLRHDLALESVKKTPDKHKIEDFSRRIGQEHSRLSEMESTHLHNLATILDARQLDQFLKMKEHMKDNVKNRKMGQG